MNTPYPNNLKTLVKNAGWTVKGLHLETAIPLATLYYWNRGKGIISVEYREKIAKVIGCDPRDLAPLNDVQNGATNGRTSKMHMTRLKDTDLSEGNDGCFSFGRLSTSGIVLDGDGTTGYLPQHIRTFYDPVPVDLCDEIQESRLLVESEQLQREKEGLSYAWNGLTYHCVRYMISRDPVHEHMKLNLWFRPTDYYAVLAKKRCLNDPSFRENLSDDWETLISTIPTVSAIAVSVISSDGYVVLVQRGSNLAIRPGSFHTSVGETLSRPLDKSPTSEAPDFYRCACRGLLEEMGLEENIDFTPSDIQFLSFGLDTQDFICALRGMVRVQVRAEDIVKKWRSGVKDKMENKRLYPVLFTPSEVCDFVFGQGPWVPGGLVSLYHSLVHEFGRAEVDRIISSY